MIKSIKVTNYLDESITISLRRPLETGFLIKKIDGLGPTKANINTSEISTNDGAMFNSSRINQRNITISMLFVESEIGESIEDIRQKSYKYFPISESPLYVMTFSDLFCITPNSMTAPFNDAFSNGNSNDC